MFYLLIHPCFFFVFFFIQLFHLATTTAANSLLFICLPTTK